jgi:hypothetical protein
MLLQNLLIGAIFALPILGLCPGVAEGDKCHNDSPCCVDNNNFAVCADGGIWVVAQCDIACVGDGSAQGPSCGT